MPKLMNPPGSPGRGRKPDPRHVEAVALAKAHPGEWVLMDGEWGTNLAHNIKVNRADGLANQAPAAFRDGVWDATSRAIKGSAPKRSQVFVKYLGEAKP